MPTEQEDVLVLDEPSRTKLDGIVSQMENNKEPEENIRLVVNDFKSKYGKGDTAIPTITLPKEEAEKNLKPDELIHPSFLPFGLKHDADGKVTSAVKEDKAIPEMPLSEKIAKGFLDIVNAPGEALVSGIKEGAKEIAKGMGGGFVPTTTTGGLQVAEGIAKAGFGALNVLPPVAAFTMGTEAVSKVVPEKYLSYVFSPLKTIGINKIIGAILPMGAGAGIAGVPDSEGEQAAAGLADIGLNILAIHGLTKVAQKIKSGKELSVDEVNEAAQSIGQAKPEEIKDASKQLVVENTHPEIAPLKEKEIDLHSDMNNLVPVMGEDAKTLFAPEIEKVQGEIQAKQENINQIGRLERAIPLAKSEIGRKLLKDDLNKLKPQENATNKEQIEKGVQQEREGGDQGGEAESPSGSNSLLGATQGEEKISEPLPTTEESGNVEPIIPESNGKIQEEVSDETQKGEELLIPEVPLKASGEPRQSSESNQEPDALDLKKISKNIHPDDLSRFQELSESLTEGEQLLRDGIDAGGEKLTKEKRSQYERSVESTKNKILELAKNKKGIEESNKIAEDNGFDNATHLLNSVAKRTGKKYETVQEIPEAELKSVVEDRRQESDKEENGTTGISIKAREKMAEDLGTPPAESGKGWTGEQALERGRDLIAQGIDPHEMLEDKDIELHDKVAIAQAHLNELGKLTNEAEDKYRNSPTDANKMAWEEARKNQNDYAKDVKPLATKAHLAFAGHQGEVDVNTGSWSGLIHAAEEDSGRKLSESEVKKAKELADRVKSLEADLAYVKKINEAHERALKDSGEQNKRSQKKVKQRFDKVADLILKGKTSRPGIFSAASPASIVWDGALEAAAKTVRVAGDIAQAVADGLDHIKSSDWYKNIDANKQKDAEKEFEKFVRSNDKKAPLTAEERYLRGLEKQLSDIEGGVTKASKKTELSEVAKAKADQLKEQIRAKKEELGLTPSKPLPEAPLTAEEKRLNLRASLVDKHDNKFTPEQAKGIWDHAMSNYIDKGKSFGEAVYKTGNDLGISSEQVRSAIEQPKSIRKVTDELYMRQHRRHQAQNEARAWVRSRKYSRLGRGVRDFFNFQFIKTVFGHGTVSFFTHAGTLAFDPRFAKTYYPLFLKQYKMFVSSDAAFERLVEDFKTDPLYAKKLQSGLKIDPEDLKTDEYMLRTKKKNIFSQIAAQGNKGFFAIKLLRSKRFDFYYDRLSDAEKNDPEALKAIATLSNYETGTVQGAVPEAISMGMFAPKLEASRWMGGIVAPFKTAITGARTAANTFGKWRDATTAEKVYAREYAKKAGWTVATYFGALTANQAFLSAGGSDQKINFTDPTKSDFLSFKGRGKTFGLTGGVLSTYHFIGNLLQASSRAFTGEKKMDNPQNDAYKKIVTQLRYKLSPGANFVVDVAFGTDAMNKPLPPPYHVKPHSGEEPYTWTEYLLENQTPIPVAEGIKTVAETMKDNGMTKPQVKQVLEGIGAFLITGGTGIKVGDEPKELPLTEQQVSEAEYEAAKTKMNPDQIKKLDEMKEKSEKIDKDVSEKMRPITQKILKKRMEAAQAIINKKK